MDGIVIRLINKGEEDEAFSMIERGFNAFIRDDFSQEGIDEFHRAIRDMVFNHPPEHFIMVAESSDRTVGLIDVRDYDHISIFFVDPSMMNKGVGRALMQKAVGMCRERKPDLSEIEVHSSPWAVPVYGKLGFESTGPEQEDCGMRYTRMIKILESQNGE